ncbi:MAG: hypothetical protein QG657_5594 [Acidobacteriota bacterium]|nr:hypothetical protein [Acidobacteriota bacterium]
MENKNKTKDILLQSIREGYNLPEAYFKVEVEKARSKKDIITVLNLEQLTGARLKNFYVDTDPVRDADTISSLQLLLANPLTPYTKCLFSGFSGSGKTTELIKLFFEMQKRANVIIFSAWNRLKLSDITFESILFEILEDVFNFIYTNNLVDESDALLQDIKTKILKWCSETRIISEENKTQCQSREKGIEFLKYIFFEAKSAKSTSTSNRYESTRLEEHKINDLIFECNKIFDYIRNKTGKETLIIIDDLEKVPFTKARDIYVQNSAYIREFRCKMVLTIPVELIFHSDFAIIQNVFGDAEVLPMIKIKDKYGKPYKPGIECLKEILERRIDLSLFQEKCYLDAITYSGGAIRELFRIIQRAALIEKSAEISTVSMQKSISYHKDIFSSRIQEHNAEIKIKFEEYLEILFDIYNGNKIAPPKTPALLDLLRTRSVMKFNGEGFYDTHPLLDDFIKAYQEIAKKKGNGKPGE